MLHELGHVAGEHRANRVHDIVPLESFASQPLKRFNDCGDDFGQLILDDGVDDGVHLRVGEVDLRALMIALHEEEPLLLVQSQPFRW